MHQFDMDDLCATCGKSYGKHYTINCPDRKGKFVLATPAQPTTQATPADQAVYKGMADKYQVQRAKPATLAESTDPRDKAMLLRDGPAKRTPSPNVQERKTWTSVPMSKPYPFGSAFTSPDLIASDHRIAGAHGSAHLL